MKTNIVCPICHKFIADINPKFSNNKIYVKCRECDKLIVFDKNTCNATVKDVPLRNSSSGMRFY